MYSIKTAAASVLFALPCVCAADAAPRPKATPLSPDARAVAAEAQLTDAERFQLLHGQFAVSVPLPGAPSVHVPAQVLPTAGYVPGVARLGIPDLVESDASLGVANPMMTRVGDVATAFPAGLAAAASFNPELAERAGAAIGREARAKGINVQLAGGVNLMRDPRNGRNFEYLGEDPLLAGVLGGASIRGIQSEGVVSTIKHYALNNQETLRNSLDARIDEAGLRESDLLAFEIAIERGQPGSVMCGYNKINGDYACGNDFLLNKVLKGDWGYQGWVMSDWGAVHDVSYFAKGLDQQSGEQLDSQVWFDKPLQAEVAAGRVSRERLSDAVRRVLRSIYAVGADRPATSASPVDVAAHAQLARAQATEGIVLLKNDGILPLSRKLKSIVVIGGHADIGVMSGAGSSQVVPRGGPATVLPVGGPGLFGAFMKQLIMPSSPLVALQKALPETQVNYHTGYFAEVAAATAAQADVAIVFATQWSTEAVDMGSMQLPEGQDELIRKVARANPNTIVVLETGNPVSMPWLHEVKGVVEAWYPGQEGGPAIADVLTGEANPSGRLPITFPVSEQQNPRPDIVGLGLAEGTPVTVQYSEGSDVGYRWFAANNIKSQFPFGYGLSYTTFSSGALKISNTRSPVATLTVKNTGSRAGATVAQVYLVSAAGRSVKRLVGFAKASLAPSESRDLSIALDKRLLANWDTGSGRWHIAAGKYLFALGDSADALGATAELDMKAQSLKP